MNEGDEEESFDGLDNQYYFLPADLIDFSGLDEDTKVGNNAQYSRLHNKGGGFKNLKIEKKKKKEEPNNININSHNNQSSTNNNNTNGTVTNNNQYSFFSVELPNSSLNYNEKTQQRQIAPLRVSNLPEIPSSSSTSPPLSHIQKSSNPSQSNNTNNSNMIENANYFLNNHSLNHSLTPTLNSQLNILSNHLSYQPHTIVTEPHTILTSYKTQPLSNTPSAPSPIPSSTSPQSLTRKIHGNSSPPLPLFHSTNFNSNNQSHHHVDNNTPLIPQLSSSPPSSSSIPQQNYRPNYLQNYQTNYQPNFGTNNQHPIQSQNSISSLQPSLPIPISSNSLSNSSPQTTMGKIPSPQLTRLSPVPSPPSPPTPLYSSHQNSSIDSSDLLSSSNVISNNNAGQRPNNINNINNNNGYQHHGKYKGKYPPENYNNNTNNNTNNNYKFNNNNNNNYYYDRKQRKPTWIAKEKQNSSENNGKREVDNSRKVYSILRRENVVPSVDTFADENIEKENHKVDLDKKEINNNNNNNNKKSDLVDISKENNEKLNESHQLSNDKAVENIVDIANNHKNDFNQKDEEKDENNENKSQNVPSLSFSSPSSSFSSSIEQTAKISKTRKSKKSKKTKKIKVNFSSPLFDIETLPSSQPLSLPSSNTNQTPLQSVNLSANNSHSLKQKRKKVIQRKVANNSKNENEKNVNNDFENLQQNNHFIEENNELGEDIGKENGDIYAKHLRNNIDQYHHNNDQQSLSSPLLVIQFLIVFLIGMANLIIGSFFSIFSIVLGLHHSALNLLITHYHIGFTITYIYAFPFIISPILYTSAPSIIWYLFLFWFILNKSYFPSPTPYFNLRLLVPLLFVFKGVCDPSFIAMWNGGERLVLAFVLLSMKTSNFFNWSCFLSILVLVSASAFFGTNIIVQWAILILALSHLSSFSLPTHRSIKE